jgi:hypothetical protein
MRVSSLEEAAGAEDLKYEDEAEAAWAAAQQALIECGGDLDAAVEWLRMQPPESPLFGALKVKLSVAGGDDEAEAEAEAKVCTTPAGPSGSSWPALIDQTPPSSAYEAFLALTLTLSHSHSLHPPSLRTLMRKTARSSS